MDILRKMFGKGDEKKEPVLHKDEFKKPTWFEENETDDELFDSKSKFLFQMFTNPLELQKHFDQQMQELLKTLKQYEETGELDRNFRDEYMKPGFEENLADDFKKHVKTMDTDLDGEIYADQLHSLLQRLTPEVRSIFPEKDKPKAIQPKAKLSDEEKIMGRIHGTLDDESQQPARRRDRIQKIPSHYGGVFEGSYQGPRMFGQSIMTQTTRKPDGTYETKRIIRDTDGNVKTTITRSVDGKTETITTYGDGKKGLDNATKQQDAALEVIGGGGGGGNNESRNIFVSTEGYALPKNLW